MIDIKKFKEKQDYLTTLNFMERYIDKIKEKDANDLIISLEHNEIYTAGSSTEKKEKNALIKKNIIFLEVNRGGKFTYHGPGQLIIYFCINLKKMNLSVLKFIDKIESCLISFFKTSFNLNLQSLKEKNRGLWYIDDKVQKKMIFIGLRYSRGIIYHGLSININTEIKKFFMINPCGLKSNEVGNMSEIIKIKIENIQNELPKYIKKHLEETSI